MSYKITNWTGAYDLPWKGLLWEDKESGESAFSHPAKMARGLCLKIVEYALQNNLITQGQTVLDPFGGVGTTALPSLMSGLNYVGCELESRFVEMGRKNIELWNGKFSSMPKWVGSAVLLQGDSRYLADVIAGAGLVVSSPPYANSMESGDKKAHIDWSKTFDGKNHQGNGKGSQGQRTESYGSTPGQLGQMSPGDITAVIASPPFAGNTGGRGEASRNGIDAALFDRHSGGMKKGTGSNPANLDHLPMGTVTAVIASPPYADGVVQKSERADTENTRRMNDLGRPGNGKQAGNISYGSSSGQLGAMVVGSPPFAGSIGSNDPAKRGGLFRDEKRANDVNLTGSYGQSDGQLGAMVVGSPPFEKSIPQQDKDLCAPHDSTGYLKADYGNTPGQIGTESGETFWAASKQILDQCYQILPDGAAAIWVLKAYIKGGKLVDFPGQWQALCEACGFETVEVIRAWLVKRNGSQAGFNGEMVSKDVARKSFFRRLSESNTKMIKHWATLSRSDKAHALLEGKADLWRAYHATENLPDDPENIEEMEGLSGRKNPLPNRNRILRNAQSIAYTRDGKPDYEIETAIDFETVLVTRKKAAQ